MKAEQGIKEFVRENTPLMYSLSKELCAITAPSGDEGRRAEFCRSFADANGFKGVYIDSAINLVIPYGISEESNNITVIAAHTDTVFPDIDPMPYYEEGDRAFSPGIGDDTACVVALLLVAKYFKDHEIDAKGGILFVANSGEEGLGNLKGTRKIFEDYKGRIKQLITFDSNIDVIIDRCVGSHRYEVTVSTVGGHSYNDFGNKNAIAELALMINRIYSLTPTEIEDSRLTFNVGVIEGGTSVNTIAQKASMLCEYRSDNADLLDYMQKEYARIFQSGIKEEVKVEVKVVGERPCAKGVDATRVAKLREKCSNIIKEVYGEYPTFESGSTDCNIPMSLGVPALCIGTFIGGSIHTREEWLDKPSMIPGLEIAIKTSLAVIEEE